jgi:FG-GAP-like repeat/Secretion system C-terminal sorting domain
MLKWIVVFLFALAPCLVQAQLAWTEYIVDGEGNDYNGGLPWIKTADVDGDGDMDMYGYPGYVGIHYWWSNEDGDGQNWTPHHISSGYSSMDAVDIDGDGDLDMAGATHNGNLYWWKNATGVGDQWMPHAIVLDLTHITSTSANDMDGDGDIDLVMAERPNDGGLISWWENDDNGQNWTEHPIEDLFVGVNRILAADVDNDGDMDVIGNSYSPGGFSWWSNDDGVGQTWTAHVINTESWGCWGLDAGDLDGDGDTDIVGVAYFDYEVLWWQQDENGDFTEHLLEISPNPFDGPRDVVAQDMDHDGDMDILCAMSFYDYIAYWENVNGDGSVWVLHHAAQGYEGAWGVAAADFNGDGLMDICGTAHDDGYVKWWEQPADRSITVVPTGETTIHAVGGVLTYDLHLINDIPEPSRLMYWTSVQLPNGELYGPLVSNGFTLPGSFDIVINSLTQTVPSFAPAGNYAFIASAGSMSLQRLTDTFGFVKLGQDLAGGNQSWEAGGAFPDMATAFDNLSGDVSELRRVSATESDVPERYSLSAAYPNPFNPMTTISVTLPESSELTVFVFNVNGLQVAELANGQFRAGQHQITFNASDLASGLYFVRATVPGEMDQVQKVMLVR